MVKTHIAGKLDFTRSDMKLGDKIATLNGNILTGKGQGIVLNGKYARYTPTDDVIITNVEFSGKQYEIKLSKPEIKAILKNFKDAR